MFSSKIKIPMWKNKMITQAINLPCKITISKCFPSVFGEMPAPLDALYNMSSTISAASHLT